MKARLLVASLLALAIAIPAANALTITNSDKADVTVKVTPKGGKETDLAIKAGAKADVDCKKGCLLVLGSAKENVKSSVTAITIKGGKFVM
jgi:hypothetical protein